MKTRNFFLTLTLMLFTVAAFVSCSDDSTPSGVVKTYFSALKSGDYAKAVSCTNTPEAYAENKAKSYEKRMSHDNPNTELIKDYLNRDAEGYILIDGDSPRTNVPGVFAAGDCADPHYRQAIVAAGSGAKAAIEADKYIKSL